MLKTKELIKLKDLKFSDNDEVLSVSRGRGMSRGNPENSKGGDKSKYKCFKNTIRMAGSRPTHNGKNTTIDHRFAV